MTESVLAITLEEILQRSSTTHRHLCPRQVLGVRMGICAGKLLKMKLPQEHEKRLLAIVETDGCAVDGIAAATGCTVGHRTMRIVDYGKVAATFVDTLQRCALRIAPAHDVRTRARDYAPPDVGKWQAQLLGYQTMPDESLLVVQEVALKLDLDRLISVAGKRVICNQCGEEVMNEREVVQEESILCRACAGEAYYQVL